VSELVVTRADEALVDFAAIGAASGTAWGCLWVARRPARFHSTRLVASATPYRSSNRCRNRCRLRDLVPTGSSMRLVNREAEPLRG